MKTRTHLKHKTSALALLACVAFSVTGCGWNPSTSTTPSNTTVNAPGTATTDANGAENNNSSESNTTTSINTDASNNTTISSNTPASNQMNTSTSTSGGTTNVTTTVPSSGGSTAQSSTHVLTLRGAKSLDAVSFINAYVGFVSGADGVYRTDDGGKTWRHVYQTTQPVFGITAQFQPLGGHVNVLAYTQTGVLQSADGVHFSPVHLGANAPAGARVEGVSNLPDSNEWVLVDGTRLVNNPMGSGFETYAQPEKFSSIQIVTDEMGYAASSTAVYQTTDHGMHNTKIFEPPLQSAPWHTQIEAKGSHVAVLYYGGAGGMSQEAYVLYESNDGGKTWNALVDEGYFAVAYGNPNVLSHANIGPMVASFTLLPNGEVLIVGYDDTRNQVLLTGLMPDGTTVLHEELGQEGQFNYFNSTIGISATDSGTVMVVGGQNGNAVYMVSHDGGKTWLQ